MSSAEEALSTASRLRKIDTGHVCDALEHLGIRTPVLTGRFQPLTTAASFAGPALTFEMSRCRTGVEPRRLTDLLEAVRPGNVIVIDAHGETSFAVFGDRAGWVAQHSGAAGVVLNGGARDVEGLDALGLPVHAICRALPASEGRLQGLAINTRLVLDGVEIEPGDWIVGDRSGICVIPAELIERVTELSEERQSIDDESFESLRAGRTIREVHRHFHDEDAEELRRLE